MQPPHLELDVPIRTAHGALYLFKSDHHGRPTDTKCVWTIHRADELACFEDMFFQRWHQDDMGWGLRYDDAGNPLELGRNHSNDVLKLAKFPCDQGIEPPVWHGYPADYLRRQQDRPPVSVLNTWRRAGILKKFEVARIRGGRPCNLSA